MPSLVATNVWYRYQGSDDYVIKGASLRAEPGDVVALVGPMGSGKTTLLLILAGLLQPERGRVMLGDHDLTLGRQETRRLVGMVFQDPDYQLFNPSVYDELAYALRTMGLGEDEVRERVNKLARDLGISHLLSKSPHRLSYGQKKLVALASVLVYNPLLLLLDEPTTNLDKPSYTKVLDIIERYKRSKRIVVIATHDLDTVLRASTKTCIISNGQLACHSTWGLVEQGGLKDLPLPEPLILKALLLRERNDWRKVASTVKTVLETLENEARSRLI